MALQIPTRGGGYGGYGMPQAQPQQQQYQQPLYGSQAYQGGQYNSLLAGQPYQTPFNPMQGVHYTSAPIGGRPMSYRPIGQQQYGFGQNPYQQFGQFNNWQGGYGSSINQSNYQNRYPQARPFGSYGGGYGQGSFF